MTRNGRKTVLKKEKKERSNKEIELHRSGIVILNRETLKMIIPNKLLHFLNCILMI